MKEKIKNFKLSKSPIMLMIIFSIITVVLSLGTSYAANVYLYDSKDVSYDNTRSGITSTDVQGAVDELYDAATDYSSMNTRVSGVEETIGDDTLTTTSQTLTGGINELNSQITEKVKIQVAAYRLPYESATRLRVYNIDIPQGCSLDRAFPGAIAYTNTGAKVTSPVFKAGSNSLFVNGSGFTSTDELYVYIFFIVN